MNYEVNDSNVVSIFESVIESLRDELEVAFKDTVDQRRVWDGTLHTNCYKQSFNYTAGYYSRTSYDAVDYYIPLTYGALRFRITFTNKTISPNFASGVNSMEFAYEIPNIADRTTVKTGQRIYREINSREHACFVTEVKFRKFIAGKLRSLIKATNEFYADNQYLNPVKWQNDRAANMAAYGQSFSYPTAMTYRFQSVVASIGRLRFASQLMIDRMKVEGEHSNELEHINCLARELLDACVAVGMDKPDVFGHYSTMEIMSW